MLRSPPRSTCRSAASGRPGLGVCKRCAVIWRQAVSKTASRPHRYRVPGDRHWTAVALPGALRALGSGTLLHGACSPPLPGARLGQREADMRDERDERDEELTEELRRLAARLDPVPPELLRGAAAAFAWRDIDAELAELVFDSLIDNSEAALVRGSPDQRLVSFAGGGLTIDVEVSGTGAARTVMGQIAPPQRGLVEIRRRQETMTVEADELG